MAEIQQKDNNPTILSLLKIDGKGWNINLFEDRSKLSAYNCTNCGSVCCDAVELGCDHDDDDIFLYCDECLKNMIDDNDNKCPINAHIDPIISPSRASRRQISKAVVLCPHSTAYIKTVKNRCYDNSNAEIIDTMGGGDQKEGNQEHENIAIYQEQVYGNNQLQIHMNIKAKNDGCQWKGTMHDLINIHLAQCTKTYNPTFSLNIKIDALENEIKILKQENLKFRNDIDDKDTQINKMQSKIDGQDKLMSDLCEEINSMKKQNEELMQQIRNNKQEETKNNENDIEIYCDKNEDDMNSPQQTGKPRASRERRQLDEDLEVEEIINVQVDVMDNDKLGGSIQLEQAILSEEALETHNEHQIEDAAKMNGSKDDELKSNQPIQHKRSDTMTSDSSAYRAFMSVD